MATVMIADFAGMLPIRDGLLLTDSEAQYCENCWLYTGRIRGFRRGISVYTSKYADTTDVYRIPLNANLPPDFTGAGSLWLEYPDPFMATIRSPVVDDQWSRYYFFPSDEYNSQGDNPLWPTTNPWPQYNTLARLQVGSPNYNLGIQEPTTAPTVTPAPSQCSYNTNAATPPGGAPGSTVLHFASTANVQTGMTITDTNTSVTYLLSASVATGATVLPFATTAGVAVGMSVNVASIYVAANTTVIAVSPTTVTMSSPTLQYLAAGSYFTFTNLGNIPSNAVVSSFDATTVTMNVPAGGAGVLAGDLIKFQGTQYTRAYVYTWVSAYNEESAPSPAVVATGNITGTWTVIVPAAPSSATTGTNLAHVRLYRTVTDSSGNTAYYQVTQWDGVGANTYQDSAVDSTITANQTLQTVGYTPPPDDLQGVVLMANGILAGWSNQREIWFSAAYQPHAWPASFALSVEYPVVGLTANGSSLNIITEGSPYIATGVTPDTMTIGKITAFEPCMGRGSIVASGEGAYYASPNGIQLLNTSGTTNITMGIMEKEVFSQLLPWTWAAGKYGMSYVLFVKNQRLPVFTPPPTNDGDENGAVFDQTDKNVPFTFLRFDQVVKNCYPDELSGQLFRLNADGTVMQWNPPVGNPPNTTLFGYKWRSKKFRFTYPQQFMAFTCLFDVPSEIGITLGVRDTTPAPNMIFNSASQYLVARIFADGVEICDREIQTSGEVLLITGGGKWTLWEVQFEGQVDLRHFKMSSAIKELKTA